MVFYELSDFGIAARAGDRPVPAGTLAYAPPEQFEGTPASPASDVYAATVTFYECLTGQVPYIAGTDAELYDKHKTAPVPLGPIPEPLRAIVARGLAKSPLYRPSNAGRLAEELRAVAAGGYGRDWEERGRSHLGEAALLLAALWPAGSAAPSVPVHLAERVRLTHDTHQPPQQAGPAGNTVHGQAAHAGNVTHAEHVAHVEHLQHEHLQHLSHLEHGEAGQAAAGHGTTGNTTAQARRAFRTARQAAAHHPVAAIAAAVVAVAAVAGISVAAGSGGGGGGGGGSPLSAAGSWAAGGGATFTFTSSGPDTYAVSLVNTVDTPACGSADDGSVTGRNGHYKGTVDLYNQNISTGETCRPKDGTSPIIIVVAANGKTMNADLTSTHCSECGDSTWTRSS